MPGCRFSQSWRLGPAISVTNSNTVNRAAAADLAAGLSLAAPQSSAGLARTKRAVALSVVQFKQTAPLASLSVAVVALLAFLQRRPAQQAALQAPPSE